MFYMEFDLDFVNLEEEEGLEEIEEGEGVNQSHSRKKSNAASVILHLLRQAIWGRIGIRTVEKSRTNATIVNMHSSGRQFEEAFDNAELRKVK